MSKWAKEEGFTPDRFRALFLAEFQSLYQELVSAGYGSNYTLDENFNGPDSTKGFQGVLSAIRYVAANTAAYGPKPPSQ